MNLEFDLLTLIDWLPTDPKEGKTLTEIARKLSRRDPERGDRRAELAYRKRLERWIESMLTEKILCSAAEPGQQDGKRSGTRRFWLDKQHKLVRRLVDPANTLAVAALSKDLMSPLDRARESIPGKATRAAKMARDMDATVERAAIFRERVRFVPDGVPRQRFKVSGELVAMAVDAMEVQRCIELTYAAQDSAFSYGPASGRYELTVLGLALKETTVYLIGRANDDDRPQYFNLARCTEGRLSDAVAALSGRFNIDEFIEEEDNLTRARSAETLDLVLHVHKNAIFHFRERPFKDQEIEPQEDGSFFVRAQVRDSIQLEPFLWSHAPWVHVVSPVEFRNRVQLHIMQALRRYLDSER